MHPEALNQELTREPFTPLRLTLFTGETLEIRDPGGVFISNQAVYIFSIEHRGSHLADHSRLVSLRHIVQVEHLETSAGR